MDERLADLGRYVECRRKPFIHRALQLATELDHPIYDASIWRWLKPRATGC